MDSHALTPTCGGETWWTDEKHLHFLDSLESSFLRAMFVRRSRGPVLRLDRYLSDSSESTCDSAPARTRKKRTRRDICRLDGPAAKKSRRSRQSRTPPCDDDQVVPQIAKSAAGEDEEEDPTSVQATQARPA
ncbi:hypothetical protein BT93_L0918 [Corymbia citriodora subsp. variegata]|uniref:Uncharacterized protein n=1 Tax=Corymbia citriodora subsp. variegata TaxID=360336 RepID=A0A8T0D199_CORYI|nr:hypothetical protein BT93_L0918 [Corymbia citriodora subsp. variegata]